MGFTGEGNFNTLGAVAPDDTAQGTEVAKTLFTQMQRYGYKGSYTDLMNAMAISPSSKTYLAKLIPINLDSWGFQARILKLDAGKISDAMKALASKSGGLPPTSQAVLQAMGQRAQQTDWGEAIKFTAVESAKQIVKGVQETGNTVITTLKVGQFLLPAIPIVLLLAVYMGTKGRIQGISGSDLQSGYRRLKKRVGERLASK